MSVRINVNNFKNLMKKGTVNYCIENVKMTFTPQKAISAMRGTDLISCVKMENNVLTGLKRQDEIDFCFVNPLSNVLPYLEILRGDAVDTKIESNYIEMTELPHVVKVTLFNPNVVTPFELDRTPNIDFFVDFNPGEDFINFLDKTKRVCATSGRIFLGVKAGHLYLRAGIAPNELGSEIKLNLVETGFMEVELNFNYKSFINLIGLLSSEFTISCAYDDDRELGMIRAANADSSETYYLMSRI